MKSVLSVATKRCYTEYAGKKHSFKGCVFLSLYVRKGAAGSQSIHGKLWVAGSMYTKIR